MPCKWLKMLGAPVATTAYCYWHVARMQESELNSLCLSGGRFAGFLHCLDQLQHEADTLISAMRWHGLTCGHETALPSYVWYPATINLISTPNTTSWYFLTTAVICTCTYANSECTTPGKNNTARKELLFEYICPLERIQYLSFLNGALWTIPEDAIAVLRLIALGILRQQSQFDRPPLLLSAPAQKAKRNCDQLQRHSSYYCIVIRAMWMLW
jgi:hypothetical protein